MINTEDFLRKKGICSDTTIGIEGDYLLTDLLEEYLDVNTNDIERLEAELYKFANIKELRPKRKAMKEAKAIIEEKYNVKLEDLK